MGAALGMTRTFPPCFCGLCYRTRWHRVQRWFVFQGGIFPYLLLKIGVFNQYISFVTFLTTPVDVFKDSVLVYCMGFLNFPFNYLYFPKAKKAESRPKKTPQKAEAGKRNFSPFKKEADNKKHKSTPEKGDTVKSVMKETTAVRKLMDFKRQTAEKEAPKPKGSLVSEITEDGTEKLLWVDKYKPVSLKAIIGQQGEQSCANKLLRWLRNWHKDTSEDGQGDQRG